MNPELWPAQRGGIQNKGGRRMATYNPLTAELVKELETIVGAKNVSIDPDKLETYSHDEETDKRYQHMPEAVVFPENAQQIAEILKLANRELVPVVARGGGRRNGSRRIWMPIQKKMQEKI